MKLKISSLAVAGAMLIGNNSFAAASNAATFNISTTLLTPITLTKKTDLTFPQQSAQLAATYVVKATDTSAASFSAIGAANTEATLSFGATSQALTCTAGACLTSGTNTLGVNTFTCDVSTCNYTFDASGNIANIGIGATETVVATNFSGTYTGSQTITLTYS